MAAGRKYRNCLENREKALDNYTSDALTAARAMQGSCYPGMIDYTMAVEGRRPVDSYRHMIKAAMETELQSALNAVLTERRQRTDRAIK